MNDLLANPLATLAVGGAVGYVGADVPLDVLLASGRPFGHLPWRAMGGTPWADGWLESSFPFWARSILEQWRAGAFDTLETVVFSRTDDASQRLYYYVRELRSRGQLRGPEPYVLDLALLPRESSLAHSVAAVSSLCARLGVDERMLESGIARANKLRETLAALQGRRVADGPHFERIARAALWSDASRWIDGVVAPPPSPRRARLLLAGSVPPDERLHEAVEAAGASVVAEAHVHGLGRYGLPLSSRGEPAANAVARHLVARSIGPRAVLDRSAWLVKEAHAARAHGVILWLTREDEGLAWHVPAQRRALAAANVPALVVPAASWRADDGALERIAEFCRGVADAAA